MKTRSFWPRFVLCLGMGLSLGSLAMAIPNYGSLTDGRKIFDIRGRFESKLSLYSINDSIGEKGLYFALTNVAPEYFTVDTLKSDALQLPPYMEPGDTVFSPGHGEFGMFVISREGRLRASLRHCDYYNDPAKIRRQDSLLVILGEYIAAGDRILSLRFDDDNEPVLIDDTHDPEHLAFCPEVTHGGRALMHIRTARHRWLIEVTPTGLNIYSAVWNKARRQYQRGAFLRRYRYYGANRAMQFNQSPVYFPFIDLIDKFYSKAVLHAITTEMQEQKERYGKIICSILQRLEAQKTN